MTCHTTMSMNRGIGTNEKRQGDGKSEGLEYLDVQRPNIGGKVLRLRLPTGRRAQELSFDKLRNYFCFLV